MVNDFVTLSLGENCIHATVTTTVYHPDVDQPLELRFQTVT